MVQRIVGLMVVLVSWGLSTTLLPGAVRAADQPAAVKAPYVHAVVFYLKKDAPGNETEAIIADSRELLSKIPSVRDLKIGRPAEKDTPKVAVKDYQIGLMVLFDNADGLHEYIEHPRHKEFVEKHLKYVDRVLVYDFLDQR